MTTCGRPTLHDRVLSGVWALFVGAVHFFSSSPDFIPIRSADDILIALGLRPPEQAFSLLWHNSISGFASWLGIGELTEVLVCMGSVGLALLALLSKSLFALLLPETLRTWGNARRWGRIIGYTLPIIGSAAFVFSPAVWSAGRVFSPELLILVLLVWSILSAVRSFVFASVCSFILSGVLSGVLAAETPLAVVVPVVSVMCLRCRSWQEDETSPSFLLNPLLRSVAIKWMLVAFVIFWIGAQSLNMLFFIGHGGADGRFVVLMMKLARRYFASVYESATPFGFMFMGYAVAAPAIFTVSRVARATDTNDFLLFRHGFLFFVFGVLALLQVGPFPSCWFWRWMPERELVSSDLLLSVCMLISAYVLFSAISVFVVDVYFRNARRLARELIWCDALASSVVVKIHRFIILSGRFMRWFHFPCTVIAVLALIALAHHNPAQDRAEEMVEKYIRALVDESAGVKILVTDGTLDSSIELAAAVVGRELKTLSIMSGNSEYEHKLRRSIATEERYAEKLSQGTDEAMRAWLADDSPVLSNVAVQVGFELWRDNRKPMPECGGFLAKPGKIDGDSFKRGIDAARALSREIISFREECDVSEIETFKLVALLSRIQWRLSRMCRMRAYAQRRLRDDENAEREEELADLLDAANPDWAKVKDSEEARLKKEVLTLTAREGMNLSLKRADFRLASRYAKDVLLQDENDVAANFASGMGHFMDHKYDLAEKSLKRALERAPQEPAILNNLAVVLIRLDRFDEAETNAMKALKVLPDSAEIKATLRRISELKQRTR